MRKCILNCSIIVLLSVVTFLVTSAVMARGKRKAVTPQQQPTGVIDMNSQRTAPPPGAYKKPTSSAMMHKINLMQVANGVQIHAEASIQETRPEARFVWSVRLLDRGTRAVLSETQYTNQAFSVPIGDEETFTFDDVIKFPSGSYFVEVGLYELATTGSRRRAAGRGKVLIP